MNLTTNIVYGKSPHENMVWDWYAAMESGNCSMRMFAFHYLQEVVDQITCLELVKVVT
jgi:hypothetical protein